MTDKAIRPELTYESVQIGQEIPPLVRGPLLPPHLMRWSAAIENWHRIHYDKPFAVEHDGLENLLINGSWKQHFLVQLMREWLEPNGWLAKIEFSFRRMDLVGDTLTAHGTVVEKYEREGLGFVVCQIGIQNPRGEDSTPGSAVGALPLQDGPKVPYPFPVGAVDRG
jgi:acyl dehydratase